LPGPYERRLDLRAQQRDLGFADARDGLTRRSYQLQDVIAADELGRFTYELEHHHIVGTETTLVPARIGETRAAPNCQRELGVDARARCDLGESPTFAVRAQAADRGKADEPALLLCLHELGNRRADFVGEVRQQAQARDGVGGIRVVETGRNQIVVLGRELVVAHENCPGALIGVPADRSRAPIANNGFGGSASSASPTASVDDHDGSSAGTRSSTPAGASHNSAGRDPCHRTANESAPARRGTASTVSGLAQPVGREARKEIDPAARLAREHRA